MNERKALDNIERKINKRYDKIVDALIKQFGDEGHDIGDAGDVHDLFANACGAPHESYTFNEFVDAIASLIDVDSAYVYALAIRHICRAYANESWAHE